MKKPKYSSMNSERFKQPDSFLLSVISGTPHGIITIDFDGNVTIANHKAMLFLGIKGKVTGLIAKKILDVVKEPERLQKRIARSIEKKLKSFDLLELVHLNRYLTIRGRQIQDGFIITIVDITSIKEAEFTALNALLEGQELERKRLAREIHDGIGPLLSTVKMNLAQIEGELLDQPESLNRRFKKSYELIDEAASDLRSISHNLLPKVLSDFGLSEALETLCEKIDDTKNVNVRYMNSGLDIRLDEVTELGLYRICQELINNTLKYGKADKITLQLIKRDRNIRLMYEDDGVGFDPTIASEGIGFFNITNRAKALASEITLDSQIGKGMTAILDITINEK